MLTVVILVLSVFGNVKLETSSDRTQIGSPRQCSVKTLENSIEDIITISKQLGRLNSHTLKNYGQSRQAMVSFTAIMTASHTLGSGEKVPYNNIVSNIGLGYDVKTRTFTAPISGLYTISVSMMANPSNSVHLKLMKDGSEIVRLWTQKDRWELSSQTVNLPLKKGSQIWVQQMTGSVLWHTEPYNVFSIALITEG